MSGWSETHHAVVFPWHCDVLGHMNVRWYAHFFDDAGFHLWSRIGLSHATLAERGVVTVVGRTATEFLHEVRAGELLTVESAFTRLGTKSLSQSHRMTNAETGVLCARQRVDEVCFDLETRKATEMPEDIRRRVEAVLVADE